MKLLTAPIAWKPHRTHTAGTSPAHRPQNRRDTHEYVKALASFMLHVCMFFGVLAGLLLQAGLGENCCLSFKGNETNSPALTC